MVHFHGTEYRAHTVGSPRHARRTASPAADQCAKTCVTEEQKYQGALYKNKKVKLNPTATEAPVAKMAALVHQPQPAYVEDVPEELAAFLDRDDDSDADVGSDDSGDDDAPPHAPTPPPADVNVNVFDFLVAGATPNASNVNLSRGAGPAKPSESTQLVRYDRERNAFLDHGGLSVDRKELVQYGTGPVPRPGVKFETPGPRLERKKTRDGDKEVKKDKKRKRLHVDTDHVMADAPPVLHSGLTGGLNRLMSRPSVFPPSPEYSADAAETPASPLKKSRHAKSSKNKTAAGAAETIGNNLISMLSVKPKTKKRKSVSSVKKHRSHRRSDAEKAPKLIEYRSSSSKEDDKGKEGTGSLVVYKPRADLFLSFINKGPDSERGCSMNKALKRFHRERSSSGQSLGKPVEEKELWRSLRMRKNNRGEIVLFCV